MEAGRRQDIEVELFANHSAFLPLIDYHMVTLKSVIYILVLVCTKISIHSCVRSTEYVTVLLLSCIVVPM